QEEIAGRKDCAIGDVEVIGTLDAEACNAVAIEQERTQVTSGIETAFGDHDQRACQSRTGRRSRETLQALVVFEGLELRRNLDRLSTCAQAVAPVVEAHDLFDPFDANVENAIALGERLGTVQAARGKRLAVGTKYRRDFRISNTSRFAVAVQNAAAQPRAVIGDCEKMRAVGLDMDSGDSAKRGIFRRQLESAAEFQGTEAHERRIAVVE